jgi:class 3 adenylate cyclase
VSEPVSVSARATLRVTPEALWHFLRDTDRLNRAVGLPPVRFVPKPGPEKRGHYDAQARFLGVTLAYEEFPFDWVEGRYYRVVRRFESGPMEEVGGGIRLAPVEGGTELEVFARIVPRTWFGAFLARNVLAKKANRDVLEYARAFEEHMLQPGRVPPPGLPPSSLVNPEVLSARLAAVKVEGPAEPLRRHLETAADLDVVRMRPFELADRWGEDRLRVLRYFLHATRAGVLDLAWSVLCPNCRVATQRILTLAEMKSQSHCETCRIGFGADFAASVEARFAVNPGIRRARETTYCIGGPANTPEVMAQLRLEPGERRREEVPLRAGVVRVRCYQAPGFAALRVGPRGAEGLEVGCEEDGIRVSEAAPREGLVRVNLENRLGVEALVVVERESWKESAATAALVTSLQEFRDLFPSEAVAPGEEVGVASLAVLFTDLKGSTELYQKVGDPKAFAFVQNHFRYLVECVARHRGGVVKTMGDAVMATFAGGRDALEAAVAMQRSWAAFRREQGDYGAVALKVGIHLGPSIAINNAGRLDFFGTTVNMAARVQGQSAGDDVVFTQALGEDPDVRAYLEGEGFERETLRVSLKGLEGDHTLTRLWPCRGRVKTASAGAPGA